MTNRHRLARLAARAAWCIGVAAAGATAAMYLVELRSMLGGRPAVHHAAFALQLAAEVGFLTAGAVVVSRRPAHLVGRALLAGGVFALVAGAATRYARLGIRFERHGNPYDETFDVPARLAAAWLGSWTAVVAAAVLLLVIPLTFPTGRVLSRRWRPAAWYCGSVAVAVTVRVAFEPGRLRALRVVEPRTNPFGLGSVRWLQYRVSPLGRRPTPFAAVEILWVAFALAVVVAVVAVAARYRQTPKADRAPMRWFVRSAALVGVGYAALLSLIAAGNLGATGARQAVAAAVATGQFGMAVSAIAAIFRHRLFELDVVIRRTAAFGALSAFIATIYAATAFAAGTVARGSPGAGWLASALGTTVAAAGLEPVRHSAERVARRLVFGHRLSPLELTTQLSRVLAAAAPLEAPAVLAREVGTGIAAHEVCVQLGSARQAAARWTSDPDGRLVPGERATMPVEFHGGVVGEIEWRRVAGDAVTPSERQLLAAVAAQAGPALHSAAVVAELTERAGEAGRRSAALEASRRRLAAAQLDAQTRFQRDLEAVLAEGLDGLAQDLRSLRPDADPVEALETARQAAQEALDGLRRLGRGLASSLLDGMGLLAALTALADHSAADVHVSGAVDHPIDPTLAHAIFFTLADLIRAERPGQRIAVRVATDEAAVVCTATLGDVSPQVRQAVEDRVGAAGGTLAVDDGTGPERSTVVLTFPRGGGPASELADTRQ